MFLTKNEMYWPQLFLQKQLRCNCKTIITIALVVCLGTSSVGAEVPEVQVEGAYGENIDYSLFRLWLPVDSHPTQLLVVTLGTNQCGLSLAEDPQWQQFAQSLKCGLITCYFVSDHGAPWGLASRGSGRALVQALGILAKKSDNPQLTNAKLYFIGNSQGGIFGYHFAAWKPDCTLGFVSIKGGYHDVSSAFAAARVPGLFFIGQFDSDERISNIEETFALGRAYGAPWCLARDPKAHHEPNGCSPLSGAFLHAIADNPQLPKPIADGNGGNPVQAVSSWFPSVTFKKRWESFQSHGSFLESLPFLFNAAPPPLALAEASPPAFVLAPVASDEKSPLVHLDILAKERAVGARAAILPESYLADVTINSATSSVSSFSFRFDAAHLPLGEFFGTIPVRFERDGQPLLGGLTISISVPITGDVKSSPSSIYLGPVRPGTKSFVEIEVRSKTGKAVQLTSCEKPDYVTVSAVPGTSNPLRLTFAFAFNGSESPSSVMVLHLRTNRDWTMRMPCIGTLISDGL